MAHYPLNHHLRQTYRFLAGLAGFYLLLFGVLSVVVSWGDPFLHRGSQWVLGLRTNPAAGWLAVLLGLIVLAGVLLGGNVHHQVNLVMGWAILTIAMLQIMVLQTDANALNASMVNVLALTIVGLVVLVAGLFGKIGPPRGQRAAGPAERPAAHRAR